MEAVLQNGIGESNTISKSIEVETGKLNKCRLYISKIPVVI